MFLGPTYVNYYEYVGYLRGNSLRIPLVVNHRFFTSFVFFGCPLFSDFEILILQRIRSKEKWR